MRLIKVLFLDEAADRSDAQQRLVIAVQRMIQAAACAPLQRLLEPPLNGTASQVKTLQEGIAVATNVQFLRRARRAKDKVTPRTTRWG